MLKVVLVEDESVIREGIRDTMPWEEYGYKFVGEAADGEMALSVIRQTKPDLLITDVKMPFMDGLSLAKIVSEEFPKMKIIIISGYDDFEYARQAIAVGVDQYLLKPITKMNLKKALVDLREKIEADQMQSDYQTQFITEMHEYERYNRRRFFERMLGGELSVVEIYDEATKLNLEMTAARYNLVFYHINEKNGVNGGTGLTEEQNDLFNRKQEEIVHFVLRQPQYTLFAWNVDTYGVLVRSDANGIKEETTKLVDKICQVGEAIQDMAQWYVAIGKEVERLSCLPECYQAANHHMAYRFMIQNQHVLSEETLSNYMESADVQSLNTVDSSKMNPEIIREFLEHGSMAEVSDFVASYMLSIQEALKSNMFRDYVVLNIRFAVIAFVESLGSSKDEHANCMAHKYSDMYIKPELVANYFNDMLQAALEIRDKASDAQSSKVLRKALEYIDKNYANESISLNEVASMVNVSANYLSASFSQSMEKTFVEYLTNKRMEKAKMLLKTTDKSSSEIGLEVGYKDPHYFSFVFKKTQGCSPREYRK